MDRDTKVIRISKEAFDLIDEIAKGSNKSIGDIASQFILGYDKEFELKKSTKTIYEICEK